MDRGGDLSGASRRGGGGPRAVEGRSMADAMERLGPGEVDCRGAALGRHVARRAARSAKRGGA